MKIKKIVMAIVAVGTLAGTAYACYKYAAEKKKSKNADDDSDEEIVLYDDEDFSLSDKHNAEKYCFHDKCELPHIRELIEEFPHEEGWTSCFAGERKSGLTRNPSWSAIRGTKCDVVTNTDIMRDEYGDYCCAMGVAYGYCNDRFLIELENGQQFTTKICDSKVYADDGYGNYHWFGGENNGKCIIEFIYDDYSLPSCVAYSGSWGYYCDTN